jgi:hypothetical protein
MTADLLILGAGIAGLSAALGACDRGAFPLVLDQAGPPEPGRRFDVLFDDDFQPVGGPLPASLTWACTRILGMATPAGYQRQPGHVVDREALRHVLLTEALQRGATVIWQAPARWDGQRAAADGYDLPDVPVLLASSAFLPEEGRTERRLLRCWQGKGPQASSYLVKPLASPAGEALIAMTGAGRWCAFGWQRPDAAPPELPDDAVLTYEVERPFAGQATFPLHGPQWLRLGAAAGLEPAHGFGLAAKLALARTTGWMAADWTIQQSGPNAWATYGNWVRPYRHWLLSTLPRLAP